MISKTENRRVKMTDNESHYSVNILIVDNYQLEGLKRNYSNGNSDIIPSPISL